VSVGLAWGAMCFAGKQAAFSLSPVDNKPGSDKKTELHSTLHAPSSGRFVVVVYCRCHQTEARAELLHLSLRASSIESRKEATTRSMPPK
jgi:hypothetical protein